MVTRIATFPSSSAMFNDTLRLQTNYATANEQSSSGLISADSYQGISGNAQQTLSLESQLATINAQANNIKSAQTVLASAENATSSISNILSSAASVMSNALGLSDSSTNTAADITSQLTALRSEVVNTLNTQVGGRYVFGGTAQDTAPVDITDPSYNTTTPSNTVADTGYYQGDSGTMSVRVSGSLQVSYGVSANNPAFEQALRAINIALANPSSTTSINQAYTLMQTAISGVANVTGSLNANDTLLTNELNLQSATQASLTQSISGLRDADVAGATVQATQIETQLQASYGILSKVLSLRLSDYLK